MKASIVSFTEHGAMLSARLARELFEKGVDCEAFVKRADPHGHLLPEGVRSLTGSLKEWTKEQFSEKDALIFIGAAGIAVRSIAPFVRSKKTDPAVLVVDEQGRHAISLLSGHMGGANRLTYEVADILGAEPVITTATDLHGKFAVDAFASQRGMYMDSMQYAKEIAARLVEGQNVGFQSDFPIFGKVPKELEPARGQDIGFAVTVRKTWPFEKTLHLVPKAVVLGIGCRRRTEANQLEERLLGSLSAAGIFKESVQKLVSIDLKKDEAGILALAERWRLPFETYTAEELGRVEAEEPFTESDFVKSVTGIGNVCERAALLGAGAKRLLFPKVSGNGVTVAAALLNLTVCMEE